MSTDSPALPSGPLPGSVPDAPNPLRQYVGVLRRRWKWVAIGLVVGVLAGALSAFTVREVRDPTAYYKATNTLIVNGFANGTGAGTAPNLDQTAFLVRSADVTSGVATALDISVEKVNNQVSALARGDVLAIDVTAISTNPEEAVRLADTTAAVLNDYVADDQQTQFSARRDEVLRELDDLKTQRTDLEAQIARNPGGADIARAELDSVVNQYRLKYEQLQALAEEGGPSGGFSTLQTASPVQINGRAFNQRLQANINARGSLAPNTQGNQAALASETNLDTAAPVSRTTRLAIGAASGLVLGLLTAFVIEAWDDRLRRRDRIEHITGLPVIAEVPALPKEQRSATDVPAVDAPRGRAAERYRAVRTSLVFVMQQHLPGWTPVRPEGGTSARTPVVMITSPSPAEGKTTTVANLAAVYGDSGSRTLVVDCDYRKPSVGKYLAPVPDLDNPDQPAATRLDNVWFIPAPRNTDNWADVLTQIRRNIDTWRDQFDIVLLDTPPMLATNDATDLLPMADSIVLVLRAGQTRSASAERVANLLYRFRADVLGIVLNACSAAEMDYGYGYSYSYSYSYGYGGKSDSYFAEENVRKRNGNGNGNGSDPTASNGTSGASGPVPAVGPSDPVPPAHT